MHINVPLHRMQRLMKMSFWWAEPVTVCDSDIVRAAPSLWCIRPVCSGLYFYCSVISTLFYLTATLLISNKVLFANLLPLLMFVCSLFFLCLGFSLCLLTPLIWLFSLPLLLLHARVVCLFWCVRSDDSRPLPHTPLPRDRGVRGGGHQQRGLLSPCLPLPFSRG